MIQVFDGKGKLIHRSTSENNIGLCLLIMDDWKTSLLAIAIVIHIMVIICRCTATNTIHHGILAFSDKIFQVFL